MKNDLKERLYDGKVCLGTFMSIASPDVVDALKNLDFDWFLFDTEHSTFSPSELKAMIQALGDSKAQPFVRIGQVDQYLVKQALDMGATGILSPLVNRSEEARHLVSYAMYPPLGVRGTGPGRASKYGMNFKEYLREANNELLIGAQIETPEALTNIDEIISTENIDIGFAGPSDLTMSLGFVDERSNPKVIEAMQKVVDSCKRHGKIPGTLAANNEEAKKFIQMGFRFISLASDMRFLLQGARSFLSADKS
ncbi:MAG: HpcH/HpaI aldolase family protein [Nitrososphaerales archaeon]